MPRRSHGAKSAGIGSGKAWANPQDSHAFELSTAFPTAAGPEYRPPDAMRASHAEGRSSTTPDATTVPWSTTAGPAPTARDETDHGEHGERSAKSCRSGRHGLGGVCLTSGLRWRGPRHWPSSTRVRTRGRTSRGRRAVHPRTPRGLTPAGRGLDPEVGIRAQVIRVVDWRGAGGRAGLAGASTRVEWPGHLTEHLHFYTDLTDYSD